jgi:hypothetical protein
MEVDYAAARVYYAAGSRVRCATLRLQRVTWLRGFGLSTSRQAIQSRALGRGRHALRRAGTFQEALRLRHAQRVLPRGVYRTRMSEVRGSWVCAAGLPGQRHPNRSPERIPAVRLPVSSG